MKRQTGILLIIVVAIGATRLQAQNALVNNLGANIWCNYNSIVKIKGSLLNGAGGSFENNGTTTIDSSFINNGLARGNGKHRVGLHWINNEIFICDTSHTELFGDNQLITGDSVTTYWRLELTGTGIKTQEINSFVKHYLQLNDRELATEQFNMHVLNSDINCVNRTSGFVSSLGLGKFIRKTQNTGAYLFPTGSSLITTRYRPVVLTPNNAAINDFGVRLVNNDATLDGYDRTLVDSFVCATNPLFYHLISQSSGNSPADIQIYYDENTDNFWDGIAQWKSPPVNQWVDINPTSQNTQNPLSFVQRNQWTDYNSEQFILSRVRPGVPSIAGPDTICGATNGIYTGLPSNSSQTYNWLITNGNINSNPDFNSAEVFWGPGGVQGTVELTVTAPNGCTSYPSVLNTWVYPQVIAGFSTNPNSVLGSIPVVFINTSTNSNAWQWTFGNGSTSQLQNPTQIYNEGGTYSVMLIASSIDGCSDTAYADVTIIDGLVIPNIFTPNGDKVNDLFEISGTGFKKFKCLIYNRWGNLMFESEAAQIQWDGTTLAGDPAAAGVYFVVLEIETSSNPITYTGTVTIKR